MDRDRETSPVLDASRDGSDVQTTVFDFGEAVIRRATKDDLSILTVSGLYTKALGREIERLCLQWQGDLGLELTDIAVHPAQGKRFDRTMTGMLRTIRDKYSLRRKHLILCAPPSDLIDLLKLTGEYSSYEIVEKGSQEVLAAGTAAREPLHAEPVPPRAAPSAKAFVQKKILHLNQSLKRTATLEKGLDSAARCVQRFLPQHAPRAEGYEFAFSYRPSEKVGGDFFDFLPLPGAMGLVVGDVSGHGLDAALLMGISRKVIHIRATGTPPGRPRDVLCQANADLVGDLNKYSFVTAIYGLLDLPTGKFTFSRAGHEVPIIFAPGKGQTVPVARGIPIGIDSGRNFNAVLDEVSVEVPRGGFLLLFTDGLTECWNNRGACYTRERLLFSVGQARAGASCQGVLDAILKDITDFADGRAQEDDMSAILVRRLE